jgi:hypothetical protein
MKNYLQSQGAVITNDCIVSLDSLQGSEALQVIRHKMAGFIAAESTYKHKPYHETLNMNARERHDCVFSVENNRLYCTLQGKIYDLTPFSAVHDGNSFDVYPYIFGTVNTISEVNSEHTPNSTGMNSGFLTNPTAYFKVGDSVELMIAVKTEKSQSFDEIGTRYFCVMDIPVSAATPEVIDSHKKKFSEKLTDEVWTLKKRLISLQKEALEAAEQLIKKSELLDRLKLA